MSQKQKSLPALNSFFSRINYRLWFLCAVLIIISLLIIGLLSTKISFFNELLGNTPDSGLLTREPFPISVNPMTKTITENPAMTDFFLNHIASNHTKTAKNQTWIALLTSKLQTMDWYQNLASPVSRILVIKSGDRAEQVANSFSRTLDWNSDEKTEFTNHVSDGIPSIPDGKFYPGKYVLASDASPTDASLIITSRFTNEILARYPEEIEAVVPLRDTLIIASLIEREAYDFEDMRYISGVIWNRLFIDMRLQIDSTLQYVRGGKDDEPWWPVPVPKDKYLNSPYNTYKNKGLPPGPISNPSIDAIIAALNPHETDCLFYFHDNSGTFHCTPTYEEHVDLLKEYFGQGK